MNHARESSPKSDPAKAGFEIRREFAQAATAHQGLTALVAAGLSQLGSGLLVVVCPTQDSAEQAEADARTYLGAFEDGAGKTIVLPDWESNPYLSVAPSIRVRNLRASALAALASSSVSVLFTTLSALTRCTIPPREHSERFLIFERGRSTLGRESLMESLLSAGYHRADPVEDPGTFSMRGDIIDIFAAGDDKPVRIELFDDEVERIRHFDPESQRTLEGDLGTKRIPPAREFILDSVTTKRVRESVKARADDMTMHRSQRDPIMASIGPGLSPPFGDHWTAYCWNEGSSGLDYLPKGSRVIFFNPLLARDALADYLKNLEDSAPSAATHGVVAPTVKELYPAALDRARSLMVQSVDQIAARAIDSTGGDQALSLTIESATSYRSRQIAQGMGAEKAELLMSLVEQRICVAVFFSTLSALERFEEQLRIARVPSIRSSADQAPSGIRSLLNGPASGDGRVRLCLGTLSEGFVWSSGGLAVFQDGELSGARTSPRTFRRKPRQEKDKSSIEDWAGVLALADLAVGDAVVHTDHGVGRYRGLVRLALNGAPSDFIQIEYDANDKLYVPVWRLNVIQKYTGTGDSAPIDRLGSQSFLRHKQKAKESARTLAVDLVRLYAERALRAGIQFGPPDDTFDRFEAEFQFEETEDQLKAIQAVLDDLQSGKPMDRLICGDVGYGKTEVALRAAFLSVTQGKQVAILVPTTLLAVQFESSFKSCMERHAVREESITRFKSRSEQTRITQGALDGTIDIVIGTHRILSKDLRFKDLGLVVIDEEQRFGVDHKELLKTLRTDTHVLTLSATPIPRTLHIALSGLRDISLITTPPVDRLPIKTWVGRQDDAVIASAISNELARGGQVFFLHNRVQTIQETLNHLRQLLPEVRYGLAHGQMSERELESAMQAFLKKETQVLVCTAIIESGLDIPSANTIIVDRADQFGLAQLYQIRGRVGRGEQRGYAYLLTPLEGAITDDAQKRLEILQRFAELGSGFSIASHDLELRGGGDILGPEQSGHISAVGYELFMELLDEEIRELKRAGTAQAPTTPASKEPEIKSPFPAFLPETYIPDIPQRLSLYRKLSAARSEADVASVEEELQDRFGPLGPEARNLLWLIRIKVTLKKHRIEALTVGDGKVTLLSAPKGSFDADKVIALLASDPIRYQLTTDSRLVARVSTVDLMTLSIELDALFKRIAS